MHSVTAMKPNANPRFFIFNKASDIGEPKPRRRKWVKRAK